MTDGCENRENGVRRWRHRLLILCGIFLFLRYVPFIPHAPYCEFETFGTRLDRHYKAKFTYGLAMFDVPFYSVGDRVFLTFGGWMDQDDWVLNAMKGPVFSIGTGAAEAHPESRVGKAQLKLDKLEKRIKIFILDNNLARKEGRPEIPYWQEFSQDTWMYGLRRAECAVMEAVVNAD